MSGPPRLAEWMVARSMPDDPGERDGMLGDLAEEYAEIVEGHGPARACAWYWRQALRSIPTNVHRRMTRPSGAPVPPQEAAMIESLLQDVRYGCRMIVRRPALTAVALASLVVGISLPAVVFSLLNAVLLRPLPVQDPDRLAVLLEQRTSNLNHNFSYPDFIDYRAAQRSFTDMAAYSGIEMTARLPGGSQVVAGELVSGSYFDMLGVRLRAGRGLGPDDDGPGAPRVVVVSEGLWRQMAGGSGGAGNQTLRINEEEFTVVGVAAAPFRGMEVGGNTRVWAPIHAMAFIAPGRSTALAERRRSWLTVIGRLRPNVDLERATEDLNAAEARLAPAFGRPRPRALVLSAGRQGDSPLPTVAGGPLTLLFGAALLVLLVASANVANLLLARATERAREIAVRSALGAGRLRLARLVLVETLLLASAGAALAAIGAYWIAGAAGSLITSFGRPVTLDTSFDWRVLAFMAAAVLCTTILAGLAPILGIVRGRPAGSLGDGSRTASTGPAGARMRQSLIVVQFALSLALVMAAALLVRTVSNLRSIPTGFDMAHVALATVNPGAARLDGAESAAYIARALQALEQLPGVRSAAFGRVIPLGFGGSRMGVAVPGYEPAPDEDMEINFNVVSPGYLEATGIALAEGRWFDQREVAAGMPVVVVNETMAARYWGGRSPVGRQVVIDPQSPPLRVVGVARDVKYRVLREPRRPSFYLPFTPGSARSGVLHIRTAGDPDDLLPAIQRAITAINPAVPVTDLRTLRDQASLNLNDERVAMLIGTTLAAAALLLAAVGLYGSMSYTLSRRTRELGVRLALGATGRDIRGLVLKQGLVLSFAGIVTGTALAILLARTIESRLYGVTGTDLPTLVLSAAILTSVAACASWIPARRAARIDPVHALRVE